MQVFYSDSHKLHNPPFELFDGGQRVPYLEYPDRMERILSVLRELNWIDILEPEDFGLNPILAVHDHDYVDFLRTAFEEWTQEETTYEKTALLPATFPPRGWSHRPKSILGRAGYYTFDLSAPILAGTYQAALGSSNCALSGAKALSNGERSAFALCRPPGHHAGKSFSGGYCYLNNAAIAAEWLSALGRVALLDIDYHAGNGTQDIFYERGDVLTISIHADPDEAYPSFCGYADETGAGQGSGLHRNFPLPAGTEDALYLSKLDEALGLVRSYAAQYLVVSTGMDIYEGDPLGTFNITREGICQIGERIASLLLQTLIVMEGGYQNEALGENISTLLENFS
ncbi:MAG: histone deacetylase family protein [Anaerolineales bacterium]|jgi:acetoin utilization deacetylase AcuC-like enzyme